MKNFFLSIVLSLVAAVPTVAQQPQADKPMADSCAATTDTIRCLLVVADAELKVPVRDILVYTDDGQETHSQWDGSFALRPGFRRINFRHPDFYQRYALAEELLGDTIWLMPRLRRLDEVVVYGKNRWKQHMDFVMRPTTGQREREQLSQAVPFGPNILGLLAWGIDKALGPRLARKQALKEHRKKEADAARHYDELLGRH